MWIRVYRDLVFCGREDIVEVEYLGYWFYLTMKACPGMWEKPGDELEGGVIKNWVSLERMSVGTQKRLIREVEIKEPTYQQIYRVLFYGIIKRTEWPLRRKLSEKMKARVSVLVEVRGGKNFVGKIRIGSLVFKRWYCLRRSLNKRIENPLLSLADWNNAYIQRLDYEEILKRVVPVSSIVFGMRLEEGQKRALLKELIG